MKKEFYFVLFAIAIFLSALFLMNTRGKMEFTSPAFENNGKIPQKYTCDGEGVNPPLKISNVPAGTKSLTIIMDDPDAVKPAGKIWDHWVVFNISPLTTEIPERTEPRGIHGKGTSGNLKYKGPCPPDTEHSYYFKLYAVDIVLNLLEGSSKDEVRKAMHEHIIEETQLIGKYERTGLS